MKDKIHIIGAGLSGCCLGWHLLKRNQDFTIFEDSPNSAGSLVAAGMLSPVTGKAFNPSWRIDEFYEDAISFYQWVESRLAHQIWYDYPVLRLFYDLKDRRKFEKKCSSNPDLEKWVLGIDEKQGGVIWKGSGRLNVRTFVLESRKYFQSLGFYYEQQAPEEKYQCSIYSTGARGLINSQPLSLSHRSAKGEILKVRIPGLPNKQILSRGTWVVPSGDGDQTFWVGANYEWDDLSNSPTPEGMSRVVKGLITLTELPFEILDHVAGVRPIIRKSEPVIGSITNLNKRYLMNGLGSKGVLYAPKTAEKTYKNT